MADQDLKISYIAAQFRIKLELTRRACLTSPIPPLDLIQRAKIKLEAVKKENHIGFYVTYEKRLEQIWKSFQEANGEPETTVISFSIAAGAPLLPQIKLEKADPAIKAVCLLSIDAPATEVAKWRFEWLKMNVFTKLKDAGFSGFVNTSQLQNAFSKALAGEIVEKMPLTAVVKSTNPEDEAKPFSITANRARREISLVMRDLKPFRDPKTFDGLMATIQAATQKLSAVTNEQYNFLKKDVMATLKNGMIGPELIGIDMPMVLLVATATPSAASLAAAASASGKKSTTPGQADETPAPPPPKKGTHAGAGKLELVADAKYMEAAITNFTRQHYDDQSFKVSLEWVNMELDRLGIIHGRNPDLMRAIADAIAKRADLNGLVVAAGSESTPGAEPYLYPSYKDGVQKKHQVESKPKDDDDDEGETVNIREMQQRSTVKVGQLVAEIRYAKPGKQGRNIYGQKLPQVSGDPLSVTAGDGIQILEETKFYAICDGLPVIDGTNVSLSKIFVHDGDVNLRTGNVRFDGNVEIKGSVDVGAVVDVKGHLTIHGSVRGGFVKCGESMDVTGGIVTGTTGKIFCRGDLTAEFIENSRIIAGGNVIVAKAMLNSDVISGGTIEAKDDGGIIAGGKISCRQSLKTCNLGFKRGAVTEMNIGVDYRVEIKIKIRVARLEKLQNRQNEDRQALRELVSKKQAQMTGRHEDLKVSLQERLTRMRAICEKLEARIAQAKAELVYNSSSTILVANQLAANVKITCGGQTVPVNSDVAGIAITPKRRRGSFIMSIEDFKAASDLAAQQAATPPPGPPGRKAS